MMTDMETNPLVSIITPSYNQARYLEQTLRSVLDQDYPNVEYWVMDAGSTDGSLRILDKYSKLLTGWVSEKDDGQADGINKGLRQARGDVVAWLNSDDLYHPGAISAAVKALAEHPEASFVFSDVESIGPDGKPFHAMHYGQWGLAELMQFRIIGQPAVFMRRTALEQAGWLDPSYRYLLDHQLWLRLALIGKPCYLPHAVWAAARIHPQAKNISEAEGFGPEAYRLAYWIENDERFYPLSARLHEKIWAGAHRLNAFYLLEAGRAKDALQMYRQSFHSHPSATLRDWRRVLYAEASSLGLRDVRKPVDWARRAFYSRQRKPKK